LQSGTSIGAIITPLVMRALLTEELGSWRPAFQWIAASGLIWIVLWFVAIRPSDLPDHSRAAGSSAGFSAFLKLLLDRRFAAIMVMVALINTSWQTLRAWLPKFLMEGRGYAEKDALDFNALYYVATDVGCLAVGALTLALGRRGMSVHRARSVSFLIAALMTAAAVLLPALSKGPLLLAVLLVMGAGALGLFPCYYAWSQEISRIHQGKISGLTGVSAWALSAPAQKLFGWIVDKTHSFDLGLMVAGLLPLLAIGLFTLLWKEPSTSAGEARDA
jgi:MFS transporter, ACS family, hexuronate transporter